MTEPLDIVWSRPLPAGGTPSTVTVSQDAAGRWFVSLLCDDVIAQTPAAGQVGIDAGIGSLLTLSTGEKITSPRHEPADRCGALADRMPLDVRSWTCRCGSVHDRDVNAARNLLAAGLAVTACGDGVRPQRESSRTGQSSAKREHPRATKGIPVL